MSSWLLCAIACGPAPLGEASHGETSDASTDESSEASASVEAEATGEESESDASEDTGPVPDMGAEEAHCCGCLCVDASWSCSEDNCQNESGEAIELEAEAGFFELAGGDYWVNGEPSRAGHARVWYSFAPAQQDPQDKPLIVLFNGGPGSATASLLAYNVGPYTMDEALTGDEMLLPTAEPWTQFANLLFIDAPNTGFSYSRALEGGEQPLGGHRPRARCRPGLAGPAAFLTRHPQLQDGPVILAGESYAGVRVPADARIPLRPRLARRGGLPRLRASGRDRRLLVVGLSRGGGVAGRAGRHSLPSPDPDSGPGGRLCADEPAPCPAILRVVSRGATCISAMSPMASPSTASTTRRPG